MKLSLQLHESCAFESHPLWVRGLKHHYDSNSTNVNHVAPLVGAWIETSSTLKLPLIVVVAPLVGAWIETEVQGGGGFSHSTSHPLWVRGLKHYQWLLSGLRTQSHPLWVRGLKHQLRCCAGSPSRVAPLVGAWIETCTLLMTLIFSESRTPCGCVD